MATRSSSETRTGHGLLIARADALKIGSSGRQTGAMRRDEMFKAFQGANGWYVADEDEDGFHSQPATGWRSEREAKREAFRLSSMTAEELADEMDQPWAR